MNIPTKFYHAMQGHMRGGQEIFLGGGRAFVFPRNSVAAMVVERSKGIFSRENFEIQSLANAIFRVFRLKLFLF